MSDFISRKEMIRAVDSLGEDYISYYKLLMLICRLPSAEPEERTAKVKDIQVEWGDDEYVNDRMGAMYHYGDCGNCGKTVSHNQKYCHECGAKLDWSGNDER